MAQGEAENLGIHAEKRDCRDQHEHYDPQADGPATQHTHGPQDRAGVPGRRCSPWLAEIRELTRQLTALQRHRASLQQISLSISFLCQHATLARANRLDFCGTGPRWHKHVPSWLRLGRWLDAICGPRARGPWLRLLRSETLRG